MKKILLAFAAVSTAIGLASCSVAGLNFDVPESGYDNSEVTIDFWHTMGSNLRDVLDLYLEDFNEIYPNIHVNHQQIGSYNDVRDQCKSAIQVGDQPNIAYCYPDHVALFNKAKAVVTLDGLIDSKIDMGDGKILGLTADEKSDFIEGYYNEGSQFGDGLMYTMPFSKSTEVLYYDQTFFTKNNLTVPTTWDEMKAVCAQIKTIDPASTPLGYDSESNWFITMCEQYGSNYTSATGNHYKFDNKVNRGFVSEFKTWYDAGYVTTEALYGAYTSGLFTSTNGVRCYMCIGSSAGASYQRPTKVDGAYPFEVGIATLPQIDVENPKVISQGPSVCIFKSDNPQEVVASWLLVKFLTTNVDFQAEFSIASGYVPVLKSVAENKAFADHIASADGGDHITALSAKVCLEQEAAYFTSPSFIGSSTARDQVGDLMVAVFSNTSTLDAAFKKAIDECEYQS